MAIYPASYRKRIHSGGYGLDIIDVAILSTLSFLAEHGRGDGWFTVTQKELAERLGTDARTLRRRLPSLEQRGFIEIRTTARNGHYQANAYRLSLPVQRTHSPTETGQISPVQRTHSPTLRRTHSPLPEDSQSERLRSKSKDVGDGAACRGDGDNVLKNPTQKTQAPPAPAQPQAARPNGANPNPETLDHEIHALIDAERQTQQLAELAAPPPKGDPLTVTCRRCRAAPNQPCNGLDYVTGSYLDMHRGRNHGERLVDADKHTRLAAVPA